jgi:serine/threonine protein kinase
MQTFTKAGRYEISGELGRGAMGVVYRATDPVIGRIVAVKTLQLSEEGTGLTRAELLARFQTEARAAGLLTHPNIVVIFDAGDEDGLFFITMELVEGKSLQNLLDSGQMFPFPRILHIMEQTCSALQFAHERNIVHRDIKPANLMLTPDDTVKVTDFGTAKILQFGTVQQTAHVMGTPSYMSPEQVKGRVVDGRSDIFSLGVLLYEMVTGEKPFPGQNITTVIYKIVNEDPVAPRDIDSAIHPGLSAVVMKALAKDPDARYQSCRDLLDDLRNYRSISDVPSPIATLPIGGSSQKNQPHGSYTHDQLPHSQHRALSNLTSNPSQTPVVRRTGAVAPVVTGPEARKSNVFATVLAAIFLVCVIVFGAQKIRPIFQEARHQNRPDAPASGANLDGSSTETVESEKHPPESLTSDPSIGTAASTPAPSVQTSALPKAVQRPAVAVPSATTSALTRPAAEFKSRIEQVSVEKHFGDRLKIKGSAATLALTGNLRPREYNDLMTFLRSAPADVQVVDHITQNQIAEPPAADDGRTAATSGRAAIHITANVAGAIATLAAGSSNHQCETPCSLSGLAPGNYSVQIVKSGFRPVQTELQLDAGKVASQSFQLEPLALGLFVSSVPEGADVFIGGIKQSGQTPVTLPLAPGKYNLSVILAGYEHFSQTVQIQADGQTKLVAELRPTPHVAWAQIDSNPEGAEILLDDLPTGQQTPARIQIYSGIHTITLKLNGYAPARQSLQTSDGGTVSVSKSLKKR